VLLSDTPGVRLAGAVVRQLSPAQVEEALAGPDVTGGMIAKLVAAGSAVAGGVAEVHVAAWDGPGTLAALLAGEGLGTRISDPKREEALVK
jgi:acetylglutamate kinase